MQSYSGGAKKRDGKKKSSQVTPSQVTHRFAPVPQAQLPALGRATPASPLDSQTGAKKGWLRRAMSESAAQSAAGGFSDSGFSLDGSGRPAHTYNPDAGALIRDSEAWQAFMRQHHNDEAGKQLELISEEGLDDDVQGSGLSESEKAKLWEQARQEAIASRRQRKTTRSVDGAQNDDLKNALDARNEVQIPGAQLPFGIGDDLSASDSDSDSDSEGEVWNSREATRVVSGSLGFAAARSWGSGSPSTTMGLDDGGQDLAADEFDDCFDSSGFLGLAINS